MTDSSVATTAVPEGFIEHIATAVKDFFTSAKAEADVVVTKVETVVYPEISAAVGILERNGGQFLLAEAPTVLAGLVTGNWSVAVATLIVNAKAAGAEMLAEEEQLAASTALQIVQVVQAQVTASVAPVEAPVAPAV